VSAQTRGKNVPLKHSLRSTCSSADAHDLELKYKFRRSEARQSEIAVIAIAKHAIA
jgi:hypothetical protein